MSSVLASVLRTLLAMTGGAALGWLLGNWLGADGVGAFTGAGLAVATVVALGVIVMIGPVQRSAVVVPVPEDVLVGLTEDQRKQVWTHLNAEFGSVTGFDPGGGPVNHPMIQNIAKTPTTTTRTIW